VQNDVQNTKKKRIAFVIGALVIVFGSFLVFENSIVSQNGSNQSESNTQSSFDLKSDPIVNAQSPIENLQKCLGLKLHSADLKSWIREQESKPGVKSDLSWVNLHFKVGTPQERRLRLEREDEWIRVNWYASDSEGLPILLEMTSEERPKSPEKVSASELKHFLETIESQWGSPEYEQKSIDIVGIDGVQLISYTEENGKIIDFQVGTTQARFMCGEDPDTGEFPCVCYND
jgi:hypothetical protein